MQQDEHLKMILEKLNQRIKELNITIDEGSQDIEKMHDYYWSNYTEMDEYGYEFYDNQQALLTRMNANSQSLDLKRRFRKMLDSPYFGRIDFRYDDEDAAMEYYIGIGNFSMGAGDVPLIIDWRTPIAGLFYDYDKGRAVLNTPNGEAYGEIISKWQYKIKEGKMVYAFESDVKIDDEILQSELGSNGDIKLKSIVSTIQKEQNQIIRNVNDRIVVVSGAAGSGKTSIALHRIAYLLYHDRKNLKAGNLLILSPNGIFTGYISHILPELGEENIREMSFDIFAYRELKDTAGDCEEKYDQIERMLAAARGDDGDESEMSRRYHYKQSAEFANEINGYVLELESELMNFKDIKYSFVNKSAEDIMELFYYKFPDIPLLSRMKAVAEYVIDEAETLKGRNLDDIEMAIIMESFSQMYETSDIYKLYSRFLERCNEAGLADLPLEERKIPYEDVYPMLYLKYQLLTRSGKRDIKHLVIDEMQDYSYIQYLIIKSLFNCKMTIVGDKAQTMEDKQSDVMKFLPKIFGRNIKKIELNKSYRQTIEIARYAESLINEEGIELLERHGKSPQICTKAILNDALIDIVGDYKASANRYDTFAVITMTEEDAFKIYSYLHSLFDEEGTDTEKKLTYLNRDSKEFRKGLIVTTFYLAKGLEFDKVYSVYEGKLAKNIHKQAKYIMATRALHELYVYELEEKIK